ncbi:TIGR00725 family protein [Halorarum halophilum]|uniref:TIGR00725 family protein n=1 Tax=Halorarum halophilum TaxID=2743090 RepID=A0A7D5KU48_9EURY|nr:TIGR00725 family protein [Halobaculum halophilum]QLG26960.1 TIGR00725 family protein [Halobaculum halophilum]
MRVSVIGAGRVDEGTAAVAEELGRLLGGRGHTLVCGGRGGVMRAACRGARGSGAETVGILPSADPAEANEYVTVPVATGLGHARNALVPLNGDAVVAVTGGPGTLSEIGFALVYGRPVAGLATHEIDGIEACDSPAAAVEYVEHAVDTGAVEGAGGGD